MEKYLKLKNGASIPRLGMGTWFLGEDLDKRQQEIEAIQTGIDLGITLIDTAEMYGNGLSEQLVGQAVKGYDRSQLFLVSKVLPTNAGRKKIRRSLNHTLKFMRTDYLDLYLLHWRGPIPLEETVQCMEELVQEGKIRSWGVSNFDVDDMEELIRVPGGENCAVNQVLYHLGSRGIEYDLLPWMNSHHMPVMAYCPLAQAGDLRKDLLNNSVLNSIADKHHISVMQLLLAFVLRKENVIAIPRSGKKAHVKENVKAQEILLDQEDLINIEKEFPGPDRKTFLDIV